MARLTPAEGVELYEFAPLPLCMVKYDPSIHYEGIQDLATGLIGAALRLKLPSLSGPELGSDLPLLVVMIDVPRIYVDPDIEIRHNKKGQEYLKLTALNYKGEIVRLDTRELRYRDQELFTSELKRQMKLWS